MAHPVCPRLGALAAQAAREAGARVVEGGTYLAMEGPQFSTRAESELYRSWGCDVLGMTNMPEAKLAREAELPYASVCMVTDYDCWNEAQAAVDVGSVLAVMRANAERGGDTVGRLVGLLALTPRTPSPIDTNLDFAIVTPPEHRDPSLVAKLDAVAGRALR
jgi:5'-methylthioadenosine phosphorylase